MLITGENVKEKAELAPWAEQSIAGKMLNVMAANVAAQLASFSSWMIAAAGAIFALALNGAGQMSPYIRVAELGYSVKLFLIAAGLNALQRWLGAMVGASSAVRIELEGTKIPDEVNLERALKLFADSQVWPLSAISRRQIAAVMQGDHMRAPILLSRLSQIQALLVIAQMGLLLVAAWRLLP